MLASGRRQGLTFYNVLKLPSHNRVAYTSCRVYTMRGDNNSLMATIANHNAIGPTMKIRQHQTAIAANCILYLMQIDFDYQKTRDVDLMTGYRWSNDCHADSTLNQHWFNISFLLGSLLPMSQCKLNVP